MLDGYEKYKSGTKHNTPKTVASAIRRVQELASYTNKYPWEWDLVTWDEWNTHKVQNDGISSATQRKYAGEIRDFIKYISTRSVFTREVKKHFGIELTQFLDQDAVLHHLFEREQREPRATFTPELLDQFFDALKSRIREQASHAHRELLNLQRDLALFYLAAATGLRVGSLIALNTHSFRPNPKVPEMGEYGAYTTVGKGSRGSCVFHANVTANSKRT